MSIHLRICVYAHYAEHSIYHAGKIPSVVYSITIGSTNISKNVNWLRQVLDVTGSGAKMAQMGGNGVFFETVEKDMEIKIEKMIITLKW